ncbi:MAG TPA: Gfo/Idh/MocA family oxidoreductase [Verrucomicrobiota bacterium]|nr:Gfo/Idh/MocA family oxidoreductase [Verrucomicrobiota bacterium]HNU49703.1 Gfo/Idh/MocA family oxidoreductase [Verrucomicrobiota bacterium]
MNSNSNANQPTRPSLSLPRRRFLARTGAALITMGLLRPGTARAADTPRKIKLGLIGCGGRGKWITDLFVKHGGYEITAVFDYFPDRARSAGEKFGVPAANQYAGLAGYRRLLQQPGVEAVAIESPPYFHPAQAEAAVAAGKHVYLAKPAAVDVAGCLSIGESGRQATARGLAFLVDFQTRAHPAYQQAVRKVHEGGIGQIINVEAAYQCSLMFQTMDAEFRKSARDPEARLRAWAIDRVLSGDIITEQNIHALDVASWFLDAEPIKAYGTGGRCREFLGDCWDHFAVIYYYPNGVTLSFCSKQAGKYWDDILCRVYGTEGTADTHYFGEVNVLSDDPYKSGRLQNLYTDGAVNNIAAFHQNIVRGDASNPTVAPSVRSNLVTILGRTAAYRQREVTWKELLRRREAWTFPTQGLKA